MTLGNCPGNSLPIQAPHLDDPLREVKRTGAWGGMGSDGMRLGRHGGGIRWVGGLDSDLKKELFPWVIADHLGASHQIFLKTLLFGTKSTSNRYKKSFSFPRPTFFYLETLFLILVFL